MWDYSSTASSSSYSSSSSSSLLTSGCASEPVGPLYPQRRLSRGEERRKVLGSHALRPHRRLSAQLRRSLRRQIPLMEPPRPSLSLKQYLKRYESGTEKKAKKTKKREKPRSSSSAGGLLVVDEDPVWQKPVQLDDDDGDESPDEKPQIDEDIEVKRMKRLEAIRSRRAYDSISEDGSGWISISDTSNKLSGSAAAPDLSPPRQHRPRLDTPSPGREEGTAGAGDTADLSPPRQRRRHFDTPEPRDLSPARRRLPEDLSPPRRVRLRGSEADAAEGSPMGDPSLSRRNLNGSSEDLSPPRRHRSKEVLGSRGVPDVDLSPPRKRREPSMAKPVRKAGLVSIEETREANARKKKAEDSMYGGFELCRS